MRKLEKLQGKAIITYRRLRSQGCPAIVAWYVLHNLNEYNELMWRGLIEVVQDGNRTVMNYETAKRRRLPIGR